MNESWLLSRRALLGGLGAGALALLCGRGRTRAQDRTGIRRFVVIHVPEGMWRGAARPSTATGALNLLDPLERHRSRLLVLDGLDNPSMSQGPGGDGHNRSVPHMLTSTELIEGGYAAGGPSVDQVIANAIGEGAAFGSLQFAVRQVFGGVQTRPFWSAAGRAMPPMQDPWDAYTRIFRDVVPTEGIPAVPRARYDLRRSALDHSLAEIATLRSRLGARDREQLDAYHGSLRSIEERIGRTPTMPDDGNGAVVGCALPELGPRIADVRANAAYRDVGRLHMDLMIAALRCDVTRVASLQWGHTNDQAVYDWLGITGAVGHDLAHNNADCDPDGVHKTTVTRWYAEQFAYFLDALEAIPEGEGTMLDHTLVLWVSEFGECNGHSGNNLLWTLAGNVDGYFSTGRVVSVDGRSVSDLHTTLLNAYGLPDTSFGNPAYCTGPIGSLVA